MTVEYYYMDAPEGYPATRTKVYDSVPEMESKLLNNGWLLVEEGEPADFDSRTQVRAGEPTYTAEGGVAVRTYEVSDRPLDEAKAEKLFHIRDDSRIAIYNKYPIWMQANAANGIYSEDDSAPMLAYISNMVAESNRCEALINSATSVKKVRDVTPEWPEA